MFWGTLDGPAHHVSSRLKSLFQMQERYEAKIKKLDGISDFRREVMTTSFKEQVLLAGLNPHPNTCIEH